MTDVTIFIFGTVVTLMCTGAMGMLGYAAWQDGKGGRLQRAEIEKKYPAAVTSWESSQQSENVQLHS